MEEISTTVSYQEDKRSAKVTASVCRNYYCVPKCKKYTKLKMVSNQIPEFFVCLFATSGRLTY